MHPTAVERAHNAMWWLRLAFLPIRDMLRFGGRSRRSEVIAFYVLGMLANFMTVEIGEHGPVSTFLQGAKLGWMVLWNFPWIALFVRRLHDQGRSARWALIIPAETAGILALMFLPQSENSGITAKAFIWTAHPASTPLAYVLLALMAIGSLATIVLFLLGPKELGANRYGPDPRLDPDDAIFAGE